MAYYGTREMRGEKKTDIKTLANAIDAQQKLFTAGLEEEMEREKFRKKWKFGLWAPGLDEALYNAPEKGLDLPDWVEWWFPQATKSLEKKFEKIDYGDPSKLRELETMWTTGLAEESAEDLEELIKGDDVPYWEKYYEERLGDAKFAAMFIPGVGQAISALDYFGGDFSSSDFNTSDLPPTYKLESDPWAEMSPMYSKGGRVPKKYYGGGGVPASSEVPTITDYFSKQNKTLDGSDIQSLARVLGRK